MTFADRADHRPRRRPRRPGAAVLRPRPHRGRHRRVAAQAEGPLRRRPRRVAGRPLHRRRLPPRLGDRHPRPRSRPSGPRRWSAAAARSPAAARRSTPPSSRPATFLDVLMRSRSARSTAGGGTLKEAFDAAHAALADSTAAGRSSSTACPSTSRGCWDELERHRTAGHLDGRARPRGLGPAAGLSGR